METFLNEALRTGGLLSKPGPLNWGKIHPMVFVSK